MKAFVSIIMGSTSDLPIMEEAVKFFQEMEIEYEVQALSAHRTPELVMDFAKKQKTRGASYYSRSVGQLIYRELLLLLRPYP